MDMTDTMEDRMQRVHSVSTDLARLSIDLLANVHAPRDLELASTYSRRLRRSLLALEGVIDEAKMLRAHIEACPECGEGPGGCEGHDALGPGY